jgi:hypothetical protein
MKVLTINTTRKINSTPIDKNNKESIVQQNDILKTYNKEVNDLIALDKNELSKTKDAAAKKKLNEEIKLLEKQKTENEKTIASNNSTLKKLESNAIANNNNDGNSNSTEINSANNNENTNGNAIVNETANNNSENNTAINTNSSSAVSSNAKQC